MSDDATRIQAIKKGTVYLNVFGYALHEVESAVANCDPASTIQNVVAARKWDKAVAFWVGSLEGPDGSGQGSLMYNLASKRASNLLARTRPSTRRSWPTSTLA